MLDQYDFLLRAWHFGTQKRVGGLPVLHRLTCPVCGRHLVNLYQQSGREWKCKRCWEDAGGHDVS